jgi:NodT family efflux transporter outer membrane factor (OMF) lipoprotein
MRLFFLLLLTISISGCSALNKPAPNALQTVPDAFVYRLPEHASQQTWIEALNDPLLAELIAKAELDNLSLAELQARVREAEAQETLETARLLPRLDGEAAASIQRKFATRTTRDDGSRERANTGSYSVGPKAIWEVPLFGRTEALLQLTTADIVIAKEDVEAARLSVRADIALAYIALRTAQQRLDVIQKIADLQKHVATLTLIRQRNDLASAFDVARAEQSAAQSEIFIPQAQETVNRAKLSIMVLLGTSAPDARLDIPGNLPALPDAALPSTPANLLRLRPDIRRAEAAVLKQAGALGIAKADVYPRLTLEGTLTFAANLMGKPLLPSPSRTAGFGPTLSIPLFDWGQRMANVDARYAGLEAETLHYRQTVIEAYAEAETSITSYTQKRLRRDAAITSSRKARAATNYAAIQQREGLIDLTEQLLTEERLLNAEQERFEAEESALNAFITLHRVFASPVVLAKE